MTGAAPIIPTFRYHDPEKIIRFMQDVFGFEVVAVHRGVMIEHAELRLGNSVIMLGPVRDDDYGRMVGEPGGLSGQSTYVVVDDPDAIHERVKAAGATVEEAPTDRDYGSREFICRDPEGNVWSFGTYRPSLS